HSQPILEERGVEANFEFLAPFRPEIRITDLARCYRRTSSGTRFGNVRLNRCELSRLLSSLSVGGPQPEHVEAWKKPERALHRPGGAHLGIDRKVEVSAERAVVVQPECTGQEHLVTYPKLFLYVHAGGLILDQVTAGGGGGS